MNLMLIVKYAFTVMLGKKKLRELSSTSDSFLSSPLGVERKDPYS